MFGVEVFDFASDHEFDDPIDGEFVDGSASDCLSVAEDRDAVGDAGYFLEEVGDIDDGDALGFEVLDEAEEVFDVASGEATGGFIEDEDTAAGGECAADFDELLGGDREFGDGLVGLDIGVLELAEGLGGAGADFVLVDPAPAGGFDAEEEVFFDCEVWGEGEFLVDHGDAELACLEGVLGLVGLAVEAHGAFIGGMGTGEHLHEGAFAGAIFADEGEDLPCPDGEVYAAECGCGTEAFNDPLHFEQGCGVWRVGHPHGRE